MYTRKAREHAKFVTFFSLLDLVQITALEQLKTEMQEELFQQSVHNTQLHTLNQDLTAQLSKAEEKNKSLEANVASLNEETVKVTHYHHSLSSSLSFSLHGLFQTKRLPQDTTQPKMHRLLLMLHTASFHQLTASVVIVHQVSLNHALS